MSYKAEIQRRGRWEDILSPPESVRPVACDTVTEAKFADLVASIETAGAVDNPGQNVILMKQFRRFLIENGIIAIPGKQTEALFGLFRDRTTPTRTRQERRAALSCLATMAGAYPDVMPNMLGHGYAAILEAIMKTDGDCDDAGFMRQCFRGLGNVVDAGGKLNYDTMWLVERIGWATIIERGNYFADKPAVFESVLQCCLAMIKNLKLPGECYQMIMPLLVAQMKRQIPQEACASKGHRFALQAVSLALVNSDLDEHLKRKLVVENKIHLLVDRYFKVDCAVNLQLSVARIVPLFVRWRIEHTEDLVIALIELLKRTTQEHVIREVVASITDCANPEVGNWPDLLAKVDLLHPLIDLIPNSSCDVKTETGFLLAQSIIVSEANNELMELAISPSCATILLDLLEIESQFWSDICRAMNVLLNYAERTGRRAEFCEYLASLNAVDIFEEKALSGNSDISSLATMMAAELSV